MLGKISANFEEISREYLINVNETYKIVRKEIRKIFFENYKRAER